MTQYFSSDFTEQAWIYISTHRFGQKYIAERCGMKVQKLKSVIEESNDPRLLDDILFYSGAKINVSIVDELFVTPNFSVCSGSYRLIKQRMSINTLVSLCNDFTAGGDINDGDVFRLLDVSKRRFVIIYRDFNVFVIEVDRTWIHFEKVNEILIKQTCNFQENGVFSALAKAVLIQFVSDVDHVQTPQQYYGVIDRLAYLAMSFEETLPRVLVND
tara:strand:+ start:18414 stop:19058 length:645 start_codon:yes stop_codon:yes gene_type:complete